jgi:hypothetical protein
MHGATIERTTSLRGYPTLSAAAEMLGIAASTLSRRDDLPTENRGSRDRVLPPHTVLSLATEYRKRALNEVAFALIAYAKERAPEEADRIEEEVELFFEGHSTGSSSLEMFLTQARRYLPAQLYAEVERTVRSGDGRRPQAVVGHRPA